jgi:membrane-bound inhibitor of C-type lysozyme
MRLALLVAALIPGPALAAGYESVTYTCERGVGIPATYVDGGDSALAVLQVEGRQVALPLAESTSGARYALAGNQSGYTWWTKGDTALLSWFDAEKKEEVFLFMDCRKTD